MKQHHLGTLKLPHRSHPGNIVKLVPPPPNLACIISPTRSTFLFCLLVTPVCWCCTRLLGRKHASTHHAEHPTLTNPKPFSIPPRKLSLTPPKPTIHPVVSCQVCSYPPTLHCGAPFLSPVFLCFAHRQTRTVPPLSLSLEPPSGISPLRLSLRRNPGPHRSRRYLQYRVPEPAFKTHPTADTSNTPTCMYQPRLSSEAACPVGRQHHHTVPYRLRQRGGRFNQHFIIAPLFPETRNACFLEDNSRRQKFTNIKKRTCRCRHSGTLASLPSSRPHRTERRQNLKYCRNTTPPRAPKTHPGARIPSHPRP